MPSNTQKQPVVFNGKIFLPRPGRGHRDELAAPAPGEVHGFYRGSATRTHLYDREGALAALVIHNPRQGYFAVTASIRQAKPWYMFSTTSSTEAWLGLDAMGHAAVDALVRSFGNQQRSADVH